MKQVLPEHMSTAMLSTLVPQLLLLACCLAATVAVWDMLT